MGQALLEYTTPPPPATVSVFVFIARILEASLDSSRIYDLHGLVLWSFLGIPAITSESG